MTATFQEEGKSQVGCQTDYPEGILNWLKIHKKLHEELNWRDKILRMDGIKIMTCQLY